MEDSLSIVLPVYNAQSALHACIARLLEIAVELSERFELIIVDDGSTDHTMEVAHDLARRYPQVALVRHGQRRGWAAAIRTGIARSTSRVVCLMESPMGMEPWPLPTLQSGLDGGVARLHGRTVRLSAGTAGASRCHFMSGSSERAAGVRSI